MAGGVYRSAAFAQLLQSLLREAYFQQLPGQVARLSKQLFKQQQPIFEDIIKQYYGGAAGLGQAVPGEGLSSAAQEGLLEDVMSSYMAQITGEALGAAQMPWQSTFGAAYTGPQAGAQMHAVKAAQMGHVGQLFTGTASGAGGYLGTQKGAGGKCCFIFVEADNGVLDRIARRYRDEHGTLEQRVGYRFLALFLVPLMRDHKIVRDLVRWLMVKPMISWGKAFYRESEIGHIFYPIAKGWLKLFELLGRGLILKAISGGGRDG